MPQRAAVWQRLASDWKPERVIAQAREIAFADLPGAFDDFLQARVTGRVIVRVG
jgi:alcohol dehydrogenase